MCGACGVCVVCKKTEISCGPKGEKACMIFTFTSSRNEIHRPQHENHTTVIEATEKRN